MATHSSIPQPCLHSAHGPIVLASGLNNARERRKQNQYRCGSCQKTFNTICGLHSHLGRESYHYDHLTMTAFPLNEDSCQAKPVQVTKWKDDGPANNKKLPQTFYTESGALVTNMFRYKRKHQKYKKYSVGSSPAKENKDEVSSNQNSAGYNSDYEYEEDADPENVSFEYPSSGGKEGDDSVAKTVIFEKDIFGKLPTEMLIGDTDIEDDRNVTEHDAQCDFDSDFDSDIDDLTKDQQTPKNVLKEEPVSNTVQLTQDTEAVNSLISNSEQPAVVNMQMTINLQSLETDEDGSIKVVVSEEDAGIFNTPQGEEILRTLKEQAKGISMKNTRIIYKYTVPADTVNSVGDNKQEQTPKRMKKSTTKAKSYIYRKQYDIDVDGEESEMATAPGGLEAVVFMQRSDKISTEEALSILDECNLGMHDERISKIQPISAKGGELYVIDLEALPSKKDSRHDRYLWYHLGCKNYPKQNPRVKKATYKIKLPNKSYSDGFQKTVYEPINQSGRYAIVHYVGYESLFQPIPHGNRKYGNKAYSRTCPSVLEELKLLSRQKGLTPTMIHKQIMSVAPDPELRNVRTPRNLKQIKNYYFDAKRRGKSDSVKT